MSGRVLLTGANGILGKAIQKEFSEFELFPLSKSDLDIRDFDSVQNKVLEIEPNIIIHAGAYTNVESSETEIDLAYKTNSIGTANLVNMAIEKEIIFVYISSTGIYGERGSRERWREFDTPNPTTVHHKSKYEGEKVVSTHLQKFIIARTGWLFGGEKEDRKNFVYKRILEAKANSEIASNTAQIGNPTSVTNLAKQIKVLIQKRLFGTFNMVDSGENISRFDYVKEIVKLSKLQTAVIPTSQFKRVAPVSSNESAENFKLEAMRLSVMENWKISLKRYIEKL
jgi:dTDP-4-dehydrorhamnose reductase